MDLKVYLMDQNAYPTLSVSVDKLFWKLRGKSVSHVYRYISVGQAFQKWKDCISSETPSEEMGSSVVGNNGIQVWRRWRDRAHSLWRILEGRALLWEEIIALLEYRWGSCPEEGQLRDWLQVLCLTGKARLFPGVHTPIAFAWRKCHRCGGGPGGLTATPCQRCGQYCVLCNHCVQMGKSRTCSGFFVFQPIKFEREIKEVELVSPSLTSAQQEASDHCIRLLQGRKRNLLVWAVTGSGKTEMLFATLRFVLGRGGRVLWASPRRDVVVEMGKRLKKAFPDTVTAVLHRNSGQTWQHADLVIATVHQAIRYHARFQLAVLDEADAYPLTMEESDLSRYIDRALHPEGKYIRVTATPPATWRRQVKEGRFPAVTLPVRYHGLPLPEPQIKRVWGLWKKITAGKGVPSLAAFLRQVKEREGQALLFVPRIRDAERLLKWLCDSYPDECHRIAAVTGGDENRGLRVEQFRNNQLTVLITTTILERGITVPRCHVGVVGADHPVFDKAALIQIAGRVGRSADYRLGQVWFFSSERTEGQRQALLEICQLNRMATNKGYLAEEKG